MKNFNAIAIIFCGMLLFACADKEVVTECLKGHTYGFFGGLLHGVIAPFDLIGMLFRDDVTLFAQNNNGFWYGFGFVIGSGGWGVMGSWIDGRRQLFQRKNDVFNSRKET
jgi:hypothetical protein